MELMEKPTHVHQQLQVPANGSSLGRTRAAVPEPRVEGMVP